MKPRVTKPEKGNKYYINTSNGGYNPAKGNPLRLNKDLTALPNCVAIYGWFNEVGGEGQKYLKAAWYPYAVIDAAKREGLEVTKEPTLGGIMVWYGGKTGEGHVAGVGEVVSENKILTVESEYYGRDWATFWRTKGDGNWRDGCYWMGSKYVYQGCIRNPFISEEEDMTKAETEKLIWELVPKIIEQMDETTAKLPADDWAKDSINMNIADGTMVGYPDGFHAQSKIRREEVSQIAANIKAYVKDYVATNYVRKD